MQFDPKVSPNVIDRRKVAALSLFATIIAAIGVLVGRHVAPPADQDRGLVYLVSTALDRGQAYWSAHVPGYRVAKVVLYDDTTDTACGRGLASAGPFYCPADERIYIDLGFVRAISGDLARAYVVEHELGHHVQHMKHELDRSVTSVSVELEADCYAGELMHEEQVSGHLAPGDLGAALDEARAVGDDRICPGCSPEEWTHGSSDQRAAAVQAGFDGRGCELF